MADFRQLLLPGGWVTQPAFAELMKKGPGLETKTTANPLPGIPIIEPPLFHLLLPSLGLSAAGQAAAISLHVKR